MDGSSAEQRSRRLPHTADRIVDGEVLSGGAVLEAPRAGCGAEVLQMAGGSGGRMWPGDALQGIDGHRPIDGCLVRPRLRFRLLEAGASRTTGILFVPRRHLADPRDRG